MRTIASLALVPVGFAVLLPWWSRAETALVGRLLGVVGVDVRRTGRELLLRHGGDPVVLVVVGWCSSLGPVLALVGLAWVVGGDLRRRRRAVAAALGLLVVGNLVRLSAVGWVAAAWSPGRVDSFHDGPATAFAVVCVLLAVAMIALPARSPRSGHSSLVRPKSETG